MDEEGLRQHVRERIRRGRLPDRDPMHTWAGAGAGLACHACDHPIEPCETEFELHFDGAPGAGAVRMHAWCHALWLTEQRRA
jgi:hypothetical protein